MFCFALQAVGNWDGQKPVFRGCAGALYEHGSSCNREMQRVEVVPGKPKVDVEVYLCYCTGDKCNKVKNGAQLILNISCNHLSYISG